MNVNSVFLGEKEVIIFNFWTTISARNNGQSAVVKYRRIFVFDH